MGLKSLLAFRKPKQLDLEDYVLKLKQKGLTPDGAEIADPVPLAPPVGYKKQPTMVEIVRDMVRGEKLRQLALESGAETLEEADDFEVGDDPELLTSGYENDLDPGLTELLRAGQQELDRKAADAAKPPAATPPADPPPDGPNPQNPPG